MDNHIKVLVSSSIFPNNVEETKGIYIFHQAKALSRLCSVKVVAPVPYFPNWIKIDPYQSYNRIPPFQEIKGLEIFHPRVPVIPKFGRSLYGIFYAIGMFPYYRRLLSSYRPDVILSFWVYPDGFANAILARIFKIPLVIGGRGCDINNADSAKLKKIMTIWALNNSNKVLSVSDAMKNKMISLGIPEKKIVVIPNGLDNKFISLEKAKSRSHQQKTCKTILYCGRFSQEKGVEYLIKAARNLRNDNIAFKLLLVGAGPQKDYFEQLIKKFEIIEYVTIREEVTHDQIPGIMLSADIFCLPSLREGWPNVVMEALACGLPVVASRVGGVPELITDSVHGYLTSPGDANDLSKALKKALDKKWGNDVLVNSVKNRSWNNVAEELLSEITTVLGQCISS